MRWDVARELDRAHGLPRVVGVRDALSHRRLARDRAGRGDLTAWAEEAHRELERRAGGPLPRLHDQWRGAQTAIAANFALVRRLRSRYKLSVLSNADMSLRGRLERDGVHALFDDVVVSAEVGMAKPDPAIFRLAVDRLGLTPTECVFVDDWEQNVEAAREVGMRGVVHRVDKGDDLRPQLLALGIATGDG